MRTTKTLALLLALSGAAHAAGPLAQDMYIRGAFNGWGTDNRLDYKGGAVYEADIVIPPGYHAFKLGRSDWSAEWVLDPQQSQAVALERDYRLSLQPGPHDYLFVKATATYRFQLDVSDPQAPRLRVVRRDSGPTQSEDPHAGHGAMAQLRFSTWDGKTETARFSSPDQHAALRSYAHSSTAPLRDPGPAFTTYSETAALPRLRSGDLAFDALFALAMHEMRQNSVAQIRDGNYKGGAAIDCACFETGEKWHYVWTRDLSYAARLGLAMLDPERVRNSLEFKLSGFRTGWGPDGEQIVQDTGSGGSWPVSTDRVSWAFGAEAALASLPDAERGAFARRALAALSHTIEADRGAAFDAATGLYSGEQSFLDWREQSYASWVVEDIASLASAKSLSTNVAHYQALRLAARLAHEQGDAVRAARYGAWAAALKTAINTRFWRADDGLYASLTGPHFDGAPLRKFDWLGQSLAILSGVADPARTRSILAHYPHGPMGAPVIYPQQRGVPVYHNRAIWPFVTAFGLKAAALGRNVSVADAAYATLVRSAALNLSNMENLEWLSAQPLLLDEQHPELIGPVINSRRQLWSVGAYAGMVIENIFGLQVQADGLHLDPFITAQLRRERFAQQDSILLDGLRLRGKTLHLHVQLPPAAAGAGYYALQAVTLNGKPAGTHIAWEALAEDNQIVLQLGALRAGEQAIRRVTANPYQEDAAVFAPPEPRIKGFQRNGRSVSLDLAGEGQLDVYRDGRLLAAGLKAGRWQDRSAGPGACYSVQARVGENSSHPSRPVCTGAVQEIDVGDPRVQSSRPVAPARPRFDLPAIRDWGAPEDQFTVRDLQITEGGRYALQIRYHNAANQINLGISNGVKRLSVFDASGRRVAEAVVQLPHAALLQAHTPPVYSTPLEVQLAPGRYQLRLSEHFNMSYLQSNASFTNAGGVDGPANRFDLFGVRVLRR
ncbi:esterase [Massilia sp. TS11]|uniref:esterase n=1 Tax=Massilia sp. TS11 TaxID=2908003 RepID=UPI001EDADCA0|nr:esterase [Massilia sp. TS11]MCG2583719.1 esterase [Massilia sp. TS11]